MPAPNPAGATGAPSEGAAPPPLPSTTTQPAIEPQGAGVPAPVDAAATPPIDAAAAPSDVAPAPPEADAEAGGAPRDESAAAPAPADNAAPQQAGVYLGNGDLLLRYDPTANAWMRLPGRSTLAPGDRLLVPPNFRTHVVLGEDVNAFFGGGTEATLASAAEIAGDGTAGMGLAVPFGRVILNSGAAGNRLALALGDQTRVITLGPSSSLAIDVERRFVPGVNPEQESYPLVITYLLTTGSVAWGDGEEQSAEGQATWTTVDGEDSSPRSIEELPEWVNKEPLTGLDESARDVVAEALAPGQPVAIPLLELTDPARRGRRIEVRGLAGKTASYVGEFEPLVKSLSDMNERPRWKERIETLRAAMARDPASLELIGEAFAAQMGDESAVDLVEMLLGFDSEDVGTTREEVQNGELVRLIDRLDDEDLAYRVLASHNINEITGTVSLGGYRPEHIASKRKGEIRYYWDRLEKGDLMPRPWQATGWGSR
jgi:hypothetical protein